ncbi:SDR family oxidoreductase [Ensifer sp. HO-A22]|jgi:NAD(P)-dependent dehydrogenase (short-subunit alcohol dehydrogenase family)|uniref:SDR family oxidoreductase n=1 Tax=Ensifer oleiphilus TaxID=2742698 RepID=A0A7Y6Q6V7_9HYPH|nr:SDR family oxidoreductase [Ensifer oleiphilus]NVD40100.1 SDR family oxidoreductase [Ensifer oleiphilus]
MTSSIDRVGARERRTVLITGASRGLGRELAALYAGDGWRVIACVRGQASFDGNIETQSLDVSDSASITALGRGLEGIAIDVLINNAGIRGDTGGLATLDDEDFVEVMRINALAPLLLARALQANLVAGEKRIIANISSRAGSLAEGTLDDDDGDYAYRCSKAALNMATVKLAQDLRKDGITVLSLHPGWVKTDMGGDEAQVPVATSAAGLKARIDGAGMADSGSFRGYDGRRISW